MEMLRGAADPVIGPDSPWAEAAPQFEADRCFQARD